MIQREGAENVAEKPRAYEFLFTDTPSDNDREQTEGAGPHKSEPGAVATVWKRGLRLCRPMCGGGSAPPKAVPNQSGAMPPTWGVAPDSISSCRKGGALPHIGRRSRKLRFHTTSIAPGSVFVRHRNSLS